MLFGEEEGYRPIAGSQSISTDLPAEASTASQPEKDQPSRTAAGSQGGRTVAESRTSSWKEDAALFNAIVATFNSNFDEKVAFSTLDAEKKLVGDMALKRSIAMSGATTSSIQVKIEDFDGLPQNQKLAVADLLQQLAVGNEDRESSIHDAADSLEYQISSGQLRTRSLYASPEDLIAALGLWDRMENQAFTAEVQAIRAEMMREAAPILTGLDYRRRFALGAAMANGVGPTEFNHMTEAKLIAPSIGDMEAAAEALSIQYWLRLQSLGERF